MKQEYPPIVRLAERLVVQTEEAVRGFSRYHKYSLGTDLRQQSQEVYRLAHRAWRDKSRQLEWLTQLVWAVYEVKLSLQLAQQLKVFAIPNMIVIPNAFVIPNVVRNLKTIATRDALCHSMTRSINKKTIRLNHDLYKETPCISSS